MTDAYAMGSPIEKHRYSNERHTRQAGAASQPVIQSELRGPEVKIACWGSGTRLQRENDVTVQTAPLAVSTNVGLSSHRARRPRGLH